MDNKPVVLVSLEYYLPGYRSGGPLRTVCSIVGTCSDSFEFLIVTKDRDSGDSTHYPDVEINRWVEKADHNIFYASPKFQSFLGFYRILKSKSFDVLYLNSFFNFKFTLMPLLVNVFLKKKVVVCPRGEFSPGALSIKGKKKRFYIEIFRALGLHRRIIWQATDDDEADFIKGIFPDVRIKKAIDVSLPSLCSYPFPSKSSPLRIVFLSRISHKKNVLGALRALEYVKYPVVFDIYGPAPRADDKEYLEECQSFVETLDTHIDVNFHGEVRHEKVGETLKEYDLFFLPTLGENFGHAILEALAAALPLLIANTTPWRNLSEFGVGWDINPENTGAFGDKINEVALMSVSKHTEMRRAALKFAQSYLESNTAIIETKKLFAQVIEEG